MIQITRLDVLALVKDGKYCARGCPFLNAFDGGLLVGQCRLFGAVDLVEVRPAPAAFEFQRAEACKKSFAAALGAYEERKTP